MSKYRKQDIETLLRLQLGEAEKAKVSAQQTVERLEQQVAQSREEVSKLKCELSEWKLASAANETGHLFRCARVNGKWSCAKGCLAIAHTTLRGLVRDVVDYFESNFENAGLELCGLMNGKEITYTGQRLNELIGQLKDTLPREGGAQ